MAQFKKGSKEAKAFMASIRAKKGTAKKAAPKKSTAKKAAPKAGYLPERYSDLKAITKGTRSYMKKNNYTRKEANIQAGLDYFHKKNSSGRVKGVKVSGANNVPTGSGMYVRINNIAYVYASNISYKKAGDTTPSLREYLKANAGNWLEVETDFMFENQYNTVSGYRIYDTMISAIKNDARKQKDYTETIVFLCWGGVKPYVIDIPKKQFGSYEFETHKSLNCYWLRNARTRIQFLFSDGSYYVHNDIGYRKSSKIRDTGYSPRPIPEKVVADLHKYLKSFF